jgi:Flp pilus assembly protein TadD
MADRKIRESDLTPGEALARFEKALKENPNDAIAHFDLASAYYVSGKPDDAFNELQNALAISPGLDHAHYYLGVLYAQRGDKAKARQELEKVVQGSGHMLLKSQAKIRLQTLDA